MSEIDWSKAPSSATHYRSGNSIVVWYRKGPLGWECFAPEGYWRNTVEESLDGLVPRPTQWRGPEDGLPPVGTVAMGKMPAWRKEEKCKVIAHLHGSCVVVYGLGDNPDRWSTLAWCDQFYPLKSDKERAVDAAMATDPGEDLGPCSRRQFCEGLYDAGFLRLPEDQS